MSISKTISGQVLLPAGVCRWAIADSPRLERAVSILSENAPAAVSCRVRTALETILSWTLESEWAEVVWSFSRLTGDGFPIELTLSSADEGIGYGAEVAGPEVPNEDRLSRALGVLACLGQPHPSGDIIDRLFRVQRYGALSYGAWIGARHNVNDDRYKIYVEVPRSSWHTSQSEFSDLLGKEPLVNNRATQLRLIGYDPLKHRIELYFQVDQLETWEVARLLNRASLSGRLEELLTLLEDTCCRSTAETIPIANLGFSYSFGLGGEPTAFSLFAVARSVFGSDESIRRRLLALGARIGWNDLSIYEKLSAPIASRTGRRTRHSLLSYIVPPEAPLSVRIGMSPPIAGCDLD
jgi:hypothetical protein